MSTTTNLEQLIADEQHKHAEKMKRLWAKAEKEEAALLHDVAVLLREHEPERFAQYAEHVEREREAKREVRSQRAAAARARSASTTAGEDGEHYE